LAVHDLTVAYQRKPVIWDIDVDFPAGALIGVIGPNGAGKSTLLKACLGLVPLVSGEVKVFGEPVQRSRGRLGYVPQRESVDWDFPVSVLDVVAMGTYGRLGWLRRVGKREYEEARAALAQVGLEELAQRQISQLSGGQQQRVFLARALVQKADLYLMDEPFAAVDAATERAIVEVLRALREQGRSCVVVHHDLATVEQYFDWVVLLNMRVVAAGPTAAVFNPENLRKTYGGKLTLLDEAGHALVQQREHQGR
jgi:manganese/zinc/iron transport system ATP- binding protein